MILKPILGSLVLALGSSLTAMTAGSAPTSDTPSLAEELTNLASTLECCEGKSVLPKAGKIGAWHWDAEKREWTIKDYRGYAAGTLVDPPTGEIVLFSDVNGYDPDKPLSDQPGFLAECLRTLAHECLHFKCPPHEPPGADIPDGPPDPANPPQGEGRAPDCNDINYAFQTAKALCGQICSIQEGGGPVTGSGGNPVPGTDTPDGLCAYCEALKHAHTAVQKRWNTAGNAQTAEDCACEAQGPWDPGDGYPDCPAFSVPPNGCDGLPPYPDDKIIPDCGCTCPCEH